MIEEIEKKGWFFGIGNLSNDEFLSILQANTNDTFSIKTNTLTPNKSSNSRITLSKIYGLNAFPFHNDGVQNKIPPRFIVLKLKSSEIEVAKTFLLDGFKLALNNPNIFYHSIFNINGNGFKELTPLINERIIGKKILRYNPVIMDSILKKKKVELEQLIRNSSKIEINWKPKSFLIIDNWRILHSRDSITDQNKERIIERIEFYLNKL
ncbi:hypothetical protein GJU43_18905 [Flavobacterium sp. LC2016-23]|uniref:TauD/TfdA family dioxygenase n=1 Tax=Flavobacterium sp. LC2016-23 TaxID=2666330 RepID=UPI0012B0A3E5|nr:TauD/TfdA family dioxygenase [Flavobacterium sp. LC2016-23]MRX41363.1 hypothetical protein [Flavobacterium sp. LC2016-23]